MKYSGNAGFRLEDVEVEPGVYESKIVVKPIKGDLINDTTFRNQNNSKSTIDNVQITNRLSIVAHPFLMKHITNLLYVTFMGQKWKVERYAIKSPRIILDLGGLYNEQANAYPGLAGESSN